MTILNIDRYTKLVEALQMKEKVEKLGLREFFELARMRSVLEAHALGLKYFLYRSITYDCTGAFCARRAGKVMTVAQMLSWQFSPDRPQTADYDILRDLGGLTCFPGVDHCNHTFRFISDSLAKMLIAEGRVYREDE